jgi:hypothetical protein
MKVRFLKSPSGLPYSLGYFQGDTAELNDITAKKLIAIGMAELVLLTNNVEPIKAIIETKISDKPKKAIKR